MKRRVAAVTFALALGAARAAAGEPVTVNAEDPPVHVQTPSYLESDGGTLLRLPPGYFLPEARWDAVDIEVRRLQDTETRLSAENASLRASAGASWPGWKVVVGAVVVGLAGGAYAAHRWW